MLPAAPVPTLLAACRAIGELRLSLRRCRKGLMNKTAWNISEPGVVGLLAWTDAVGPGMTSLTLNRVSLIHRIPKSPNTLTHFHRLKLTTTSHQKSTQRAITLFQSRDSHAPKEKEI